ncbi:TIGR01459 family HAD-type hydrolase [Govanella unica]|uniref:TIGR01459 family HAD-type hydrolase n=1 Tax=Govanella unica TaxID=2975056 RepID=A0A9X3Z796_9PROT|nr:TIGR01459 family HAD-type hydrolase [Govania unica]MDA5193936.1 TIGR01459 family HAD-type hydrolase [Govania unica]
MTRLPQPPKALHLQGIAAIVDQFDAVLCDVWGVIHNGQQAHADALDALGRLRALDKPVVLLSNSPRPAPPIFGQLQGFGVQAGQHFDALVTAGDMARAVVLERFADKRCYHIGPDRDLPLFDALPVTLTTGVGDADVLMCTGLVDEYHETAADYLPLLERAAARGLPLICANPDLIVHMGDDLIPCAGAIAVLYDQIGGSSIYCGKPHESAYAHTLRVIAGCAGRVIPASRVLAIGDAFDTDIRGAKRAGLPSLLISSGIHRDEHGGDHDRLTALGQDRGFLPDWVMDHLAW